MPTTREIPRIPELHPNGDQQAIVKHVLRMLDLAREQERYGPFVLLYSPHWAECLGMPYIVHQREWSDPDHHPATMTLMGRLLTIHGISNIIRAAGLESHGLVLAEIVCISLDEHLEFGS